MNMLRVEQDYTSPLPDDDYEYEVDLYRKTASYRDSIVRAVLAKKAWYAKTGRGELATNSHRFDGASEILMGIRKGAASWRALDLIYRGRELARTDDEHYWLNMLNAQAVRNRFKKVRKKVKDEVLHQITIGVEKPQLASIACGSAHAVIETIRDFKREGVYINSLLIDIAPDALKYAKGIAADCGVFDQCHFIEANASGPDTRRILNEFNPDIIEMLGLLDYVTDKGTQRLFKTFFDALRPHGTFLTCNIAPNPEQDFLTHVIDWPMIYRTEEELRQLLSSSFNPDNIKIIYEPHRIHGVAIARKT